MSKEDLQILLQILTVFVGFYLAFFKSYFQEKGKNVATKEDIEEITEKIETVKSEVGLVAHKKISIATERQKTLLELNGNYSAWLNYILHAEITGDHLEPETFAGKQREKLDQYFHNFLIANARFEVFLNGDNDILNIKNDLKLKTIELSNLFSEYLVRGGLESKHIQITNELTDNDYKRGQIDKYYRQLLTVSEEYHTKLHALYRNLVPIHHQFIEMVAERITST